MTAGLVALRDDRVAAVRSSSQRASATVVAELDHLAAGGLHALDQRGAPAGRNESSRPPA